MKIAIVAPSHVPFIRGGMENLVWDLCSTINDQTDNEADLIKLPTKEDNFWDLIESYEQYYHLDLSHFDAIIVSKYPAWMVQHDNCIFYVAHRLRGLYDTYPSEMSLEVEKGNSKIEKVLHYIDKHPHPASLNIFFEMLHQLKVESGVEEERWYTFPGPLIRKIIHYMDDFAFYNRATRYFSISQTVKNRRGYFPENASVEVLHLPSTINKTCSCGVGQYIFLVSRLDSAKRIDMLIEAMKYVKSDVKLLIAGTGPEKNKLEVMAKNDKRICFLGYISDEDVDKYYGNCLVVPYFPFDEDYGFITVETMMHKKPVITTYDSGGPTEFVKNYETGFVTDFNAEKIAERIDYIVENPQQAKEMGERGFNLVKNLNWLAIVNELISAAEEFKKKQYITITSTFNIYPPRGGGQERIFSLYKSVAQQTHKNISIVSYVNHGSEEYDDWIADNLREVCIAKSLEHQNKEIELSSMAKFDLGDIAQILCGSMTQKYVLELKSSIVKSNWVVISHPYLYYSALPYLSGKHFIYEVQDIEYDLKRTILPDSKIKKEILDKIKEVERECCVQSEYVLTCSKEDASRIEKLYDIDSKKIIVVPNGVNVEETKFCTTEERQENKQLLGLSEGHLIGIFMGSWHGPNINAAKEVILMAKNCPSITFLLMGSVCDYFRGYTIPKNVGLLGVVSASEKQKVFDCVDFALNPMRSGSGTNLKMFDYMSAGIPVITTRFGTRGIDDKTNFIFAETISDFVNEICKFQLEDHEEMAKNGRNYVQEYFDWSIISKMLLPIFKI